VIANNLRTLLLAGPNIFFSSVGCSQLTSSRTDMCNPRPAALFGAARVVFFMILKWYFKRIFFLNFSCYSFRNHLLQAFALDLRFAVLEVHEQRTVPYCNYLGTVDHEANINFRAICNCYATAQIKLFVIHMRGLQRLCCLKLFEQFVGPDRQLFVRTEYY